MAMVLPLLAACAVSPAHPARLGAAASRFTSTQAVLLDFEFDGLLDVATDSKVDPKALIEAQLMFAIGDLNGHQSVGRYERLETSQIARRASAVPGRDELVYRAKLPVAWGGSTVPSVYSLTLPARIAEEDQADFAARYAATCIDASDGTVPVSQMFIAFQPHAAGCAFAQGDVVTLHAAVTVSAGNTTGKYPEYPRIWDDGALNIVAMFSQELESPDESDGGVKAYDQFVGTANDYLRQLQPDGTKRVAPAELTATPGLAMRQVRVGATLPDGRVVNVDAMLVRHRLDDDGAIFDQWYDPLTPEADVILYNGHAGLGENVRALMTKGSFRAAKYVMWMVNGCDTFAYVDRTLIERRALLNPDDPEGTRYMDTISNVMPAYFDTSTGTSMAFIQAIVDARNPAPAPETYQQIFAKIDRDQVMVVTGEEDNVFQPASIEPIAAPRSAGDDVVAPTVRNPRTAADEAATSSSNASCTASHAHTAGAPLPAIAGALMMVAGTFLRRSSRSRLRPGRIDQVTS